MGFNSVQHQTICSTTVEGLELGMCNLVLNWGFELEFIFVLQQIAAPVGMENVNELISSLNPFFFITEVFCCIYWVSS